MKIDASLLPLVGEYAWHSVTVDPRIADISREHYKLIRPIIDSSFPERALSDLSVLEVACYAHTTGYDLARDLRCDVTLFELSAATLRLGRSLADQEGPRPRLVIGDFHQLPFDDGAFDFVYICSALHHTWNFMQVARELMRVIRPGGILFIENEPCLREACFYRFRCNREANFTNLEKHLCSEGWLRTFAEPYIGSRPETLFGMIENQQMPLPDLLAVFRESGYIENIEVYPEICMGPREQAWFNARDEGIAALTERIEHDILNGLDAARPLVGPVETGLGFTLPEAGDVAPLAARTAARLCALTGDPTETGFRCGLAETFGAAVRLTVRRHGPIDGKRPPVTVRANVMEPDGIFNGFPSNTRNLLGQLSRLPDLQIDPPSRIIQAFPENDWSLSRSDQAVVGVSPRKNRVLINIPSDRQESLLILSIHCGIGSSGPYELRLVNGSHPLTRIQAYHSESRLCLAHLPPGVSQVSMEAVPIHPNLANPFTPSLAVAYAGLFSIPA